MSTILKHAASAVRPALCALTRPCLRNYVSRSQRQNISDPLLFPSNTDTPLLADLIQDLYLKELRIYKAPPAAKDAHVGAVKAFSVPTAPSAPTLPDLATELAAYDATEPTRADATDVSPVHGGPTAGAEAYLAFLEAEVPEEAHH
ncbi:ATP synthase complex subunit H-domain-containing protein [Lactarius hengduanensis]|nr:ATP synthase complex subunit H-domain-containing protein [Lactarius hengduanensis]